MERIEGLENAASALRGTVITIGNFDGLHLGHQALVSRTRALAASFGVRSALLTFTPHPVRVLAPALAPPLIATLLPALARAFALLDIGIKAGKGK